MTQPVAPSEESLAAARALLAQQADSVQGQDVAGVYGDPAGAGTPSPAQSPEQIAAGLTAKGAVPASVDTDALLAQLQALAAQVSTLQAERDAAQPVAAPVVPLKLHEVVAGAVPAGVVHAFQLAEDRLLAVEHHLGLRKDDTPAA